MTAITREEPLSIRTESYQTDVKLLVSKGNGVCRWIIQIPHTGRGEKPMSIIAKNYVPGVSRYRSGWGRKILHTPNRNALPTANRKPAIIRAEGHAADNVIVFKV